MINPVDRWGHTPLDDADVANYVDVKEELLKNKAKYNKMDKEPKLT